MVAYGNCLIIILQDVIYVYDLSNWYPEFSDTHLNATQKQTTLIET